jgi:hypothetical protein
LLLKKRGYSPNLRLWLCGKIIEQNNIFLAKIKTDRFFMDNNSPFLHFLNVNWKIVRYSTCLKIAFCRTHLVPPWILAQIHIL